MCTPREEWGEKPVCELQYYDHEQDMAHGIFAFAFLHVQLVFVDTLCLEKGGGAWGWGWGGV